MKRSNGQKTKRKTWLWVLGWLFLFPVPLTIIVHKNQKISKTLKAVILVIAWTLYLVFCIISGSSQPAESGESDPTLAESSIEEESAKSRSVSVEGQNTEEKAAADISAASESKQSGQAEQAEQVRQIGQAGQSDQTNQDDNSGVKESSNAPELTGVPTSSGSENSDTSSEPEDPKADSTPSGDSSENAGTPAEPEEPNLDSTPNEDSQVSQRKEDLYNGNIQFTGHYYATPNGKKYHYSAECGGKNSTEITWEEAVERGLEPCGTCVLK